MRDAYYTVSAKISQTVFLESNKYVHEYSCTCPQECLSVLMCTRSFIHVIGRCRCVLLFLIVQWDLWYDSIARMSYVNIIRMLKEFYDHHKR